MSKLKSAKKSLNVDSPSFTPASLQSLQSKKSTFSSQAASAAVFTPRGAGATTPVPPSAPQETDPAVFNAALAREFSQAQSYDLNGMNGGSSDSGNPYDAYNMSTVGQALQSTQFNPYDQANLSNHGAAYYQNQTGFSATFQPPNYHLYFPMGSHPRQELAPYQKTVHDFFLPEKLREDYQKKAHAALQVIPNSIQLDNYHSLATLDTIGRKIGGVFNYVSWVYKAVSYKTGRTVCLRRLEGYRLTNENAIRSVKEWKRIDSGFVVGFHDAFTTRGFGDSSLVFAQDYFPMSKTLAEQHFPSNAHASRFRPNVSLREEELWAYIVQISSALNTIHRANLAARCLDLTKIILTDKHRIRLNGCVVLDVVNYESRRPIADLQQEDFLQFGRSMLAIATNTPPSQLGSSMNAAMEALARAPYRPDLKELIGWLLSTPQAGAQKNVETLINFISPHMANSFDMMAHSNDSLNADLFREVENGRVARLLLKLGAINERQDFAGDHDWAEHGERYMLKLFRDYVFHSVDEHNKPVLDMGHMMRALSKLDAGTDELVRLTAREGETDFVVSYKNLNKMVSSAFGDLSKAARQSGAGL